MARILTNFFKNLNSFTDANVIMVKSRDAGSAVQAFTKHFNAQKNVAENGGSKESIKASNVFAQMLQTEDHYACEKNGFSMLSKYGEDIYFLFCGHSGNFITMVSNDPAKEMEVEQKPNEGRLVSLYKMLCGWGARDEYGRVLQQSDGYLKGYSEYDGSEIYGGVTRS